MKHRGFHFLFFIFFLTNNNTEKVWHFFHSDGPVIVNVSIDIASLNVDADDMVNTIFSCPPRLFVVARPIVGIKLL